MRVALLIGSDQIDLPLACQQLVAHEVQHWKDCMEWSPEELTERCRTVEVVVTGRRSPRLPAGLESDLGALRLLAHCHGSVKHLVSKAMIERGLLVTNWGDQVFVVAESALGLLLMAMKQWPALDHLIQSDWTERIGIHHDFPATLEGRDVGVYGYGPIGRHFVNLLLAFRARPIVYDPYAGDLPEGVRRVEDLRDLFAASQAVSIHCGLNDQTRGSVTAELLALLPQGGVVVNTARGPIVDEAALAAEVRKGRLLAAVDVISNERDWAGSPLFNLPGAILTGHKASRGGGLDAPPETRAKPVGLPEHVITNIQHLDCGEPLESVITAPMYDLKT